MYGLITLSAPAWHIRKISPLLSLWSQIHTNSQKKELTLDRRVMRNHNQNNVDITQML